MRIFLGILAALSLASGCRGPAASLYPSAWMERMRSLVPTAHADMPQVQIALVRRSLGDHFLNHDLWADVDENIDPDRRPIYEANGLRIGVISGTLPAELHRLITAEKNGTTSRQVAIQPGHWYFLPLGAGDQYREFDLRQDGEIVPVKFERAQCGIALQIESRDDGRVVLRFEPRIQHGATQILTRPAEDRSRLTPLIGRPEEKLSRLAFEAELAANEYLVLGVNLRAEQSFGRACLIQPEPEANAQYLLVLRCIPARKSRQAPSSAPPPAGAPLAIQSLQMPPPALPVRREAFRGQTP